MGVLIFVCGMIAGACLCVALFALALHEGVK